MTPDVEALASPERDLIRRFIEHDDRVCDQGDACPLRIEGRVMLADTPALAALASSPFRRVTDDLTGGDGCACHTGVGYNSSCEHCFGSGATSQPGPISPARPVEPPAPDERDAHDWDCNPGCHADGDCCGERPCNYGPPPTPDERDACAELRSDLSDALTANASLIAEGHERDATIGMLSDRLEAIAWNENDGRCWCRQSPDDGPGKVKAHEDICLDIRAALTNTESAARAWRESVEKPWREALWATRVRELNIEGSPCWCIVYPERGVHDSWCGEARALLSQPDKQDG